MGSDTIFQGVLLACLLVLQSPGPAASTPDGGPVAERVEVVVLHNELRCLACLRLEEYTRETLDRHFRTEMEAGRVTCRTLNLQDPSNRGFVGDHLVDSWTVVISLRGAEGEVAFRELGYLRALTTDRDAFIAALFREIESLLKMGSDTIF